MAAENKEKEASADTLDRPLFRDIDMDDDPEITEMESLCMNCEEQGMTRLFLTKIPFFREVILSSFSCDHCNYRNARLQPSGRIQDRGVSYSLKVKNLKDMDRQVVQTEYATVCIPHLDFEIPPGNSALTTIEGIIGNAVNGLQQGQVIRKIQQPEIAEKIEEFIKEMENLKTVPKPFQFTIDDPSGNSFLENPNAPEKDPDLVVGQYARSRAQDESLGLYEQEQGNEEEIEQAEVIGQDDGQGLNTQNEVLQFAANCPSCNSPCQTNMKIVNIPHFKEVVIMATVCDKCGYRDNEVKSSGGIEEQGRRIELTINTAEDLARDILKSETSTISIPELNFETGMGTMGGKFTTVEGVLDDVITQLNGNPFMDGDSSQPGIQKKLADFCVIITDIKDGRKKGVVLVLDDATGNSYIQSLCSPDPDPQLKTICYDRDFEQNESLGLNDMKTENYE